VCVDAFRHGRLAFTEIVPTVQAVLSSDDVPSEGQSMTVEDVLAADAWARTAATELIEGTR
jgi:1-deoxy-D-xylulose-5-phosphate reductoisomerase